MVLWHIATNIAGIAGSCCHWNICKNAQCCIPEVVVLGGCNSHFHKGIEVWCVFEFRNQIILKSLWLYNCNRSRDSVVSIVTGYRLDDWGGRSSSPSRVKNFLFSISSRPALGPTQPPIQWVPGVKRPGLDADQSPPVNAKVKKKCGSIHPLPNMPWCSA
jgi:hypothetical protein